jgi:hypothetical protein
MLFRILRDRLRGVWCERVTGEIHDELAHHGLATADYVRRGMTPEDARAATIRQVGNMPSLRTRGMRFGVEAIEATVSDARFALRLMRRQPRFSLIALLTIALGIGATSTILWRTAAAKPLPYPDAGRLAMV